MPQINPESQTAIQPGLVSGENILWAGQPNPSVIFHKQDFSLIPFSLLWGGFAIFFEAAIAGLLGGVPQHNHGAPMLALVWGGAFVLMGQYMIWGRFIYTGWKKRHTHYAVTDRRVIVVQNGFSRKMVSAYIDALQTLTKEERTGGLGTLRFAQKESIWSVLRGWGVWDAMDVGSSPTFVDIDDVQAVYRLVSDLREKARTPKASY